MITFVKLYPPHVTGTASKGGTLLMPRSVCHFQRKGCNLVMTLSFGWMQEPEDMDYVWKPWTVTGQYSPPISPGQYPPRSISPWSIPPVQYLPLTIPPPPIHTFLTNDVIISSLNCVIHFITRMLITPNTPRLVDPADSTPSCMHAFP